MYMLNMVIILIVMYCNVVTAIDKIPTYLLRFNSKDRAGAVTRLEPRCEGMSEEVSLRFLLVSFQGGVED